MDSENNYAWGIRYSPRLGPQGYIAYKCICGAQSAFLTPAKFMWGFNTIVVGEVFMMQQEYGWLGRCGDGHFYLGKIDF